MQYSPGEMNKQDVMGIIKEIGGKEHVGLFFFH